jgi:hypothetical protein
LALSPTTVATFEPLVVTSWLNSEAVGGLPPRTMPVKAAEEDGTVLEDM